MKVCLVFRQDMRKDGPVECYCHSALRALENLGIDVTTAGEGHKYESLEQLDENNFDFLLEIENGRNPKGEIKFQQSYYNWSIPSAVWLIDSHGRPDLHQSISSSYNHVFFAVWNKRDLFAKHPSAHWCPNATDLKWFDARNYPYYTEYSWGFIGSKTGLFRADPMIEICKKNRWSYSVKETSKPFKHKWPKYPIALSECLNLFNHGQKHDGPNLRVVESMAMRRPLITDVDPKDGMSKLFEEGKHFLGYETLTYNGLEEKMKWAMDYKYAAAKIAMAGCQEVRDKHLVSHRIDQILEVVRAES